MARRTSLVCQHLENISRGALEKYQHIIRSYVRGRHGVYALYRGGKLYYVGLASDLQVRLGHHLKNRHAESWDRFSVYLTIGDGHLRELESLLLRIIKTKGNRQKGKLVKSQDLAKNFKRDISSSWRLELNELFGSIAKSTVQPALKKFAGRKPILADHISKPIKLRARFKGKMVVARARRDGSVLFSGKTFTSPSLAGAAACGRKTCNGWTFWHYERAPGDWVPLDTLRK